jgi:hypothetical protein
MILSITVELVYFLLVLLIVFVGFGQAFYLLHQTGTSDGFTSPLEGPQQCALVATCAPKLDVCSSLLHYVFVHAWRFRLYECC